MRILEIATSGTIGTPLMGPVSTVICELSNRFAARGHEVTVVDFERAECRPLLHPAIRVVQLRAPPENPMSGRSRARELYQTWFNSYRFARQLPAQLDLPQANVVHMHSPELAFLLQRMHGIRGAYTAHTPVWSLPSGGRRPAERRKSTLRGRTYAQFLKRLEQAVIGRAALTVGLGSYLKDALPTASVVTIPNGVDFSSWCPLDRSASREALNIAPDDFVVVFTGRIAHVKGIDVLLSAIRLLSGRVANLKVYIIGSLSGSFDGRDSYVDAYARSMLESARDLPVSFLGFISNRDTRFRQYIASADLSVVPSRLEPQGLVVLESLAMGTPVVGSNTGGIPDMVTPDIGYLFPPSDTAALAACIREASGNPQRLRSMGFSARARVQAVYSWDSIADRYLAAFSREKPGVVGAAADSRHPKSRAVDALSRL
jgi:glycosyltransferase involved in cell wall biosynthesis